jgi:hypothetical protein
MERQVAVWRPRPAGRCYQVRRLRLPSGEAVTLGAITSALFLTACERPLPHFPRGRAFDYRLVPGSGRGRHRGCEDGRGRRGGCGHDAGRSGGAPCQAQPRDSEGGKTCAHGQASPLTMRKSRKIRGTYLIFQLITRSSRAGVQSRQASDPLTLGSGRGRPVTSQARPRPQRQARTAPDRGPAARWVQGTAGYVPMARRWPPGRSLRVRPARSASCRGQLVHLGASQGVPADTSEPAPRPRTPCTTGFTYARRRNVGLVSAGFGDVRRRSRQREMLR